MTAAIPSPRRVVVTGMGMVTALGQGVEPTWEGVVAGRSGALSCSPLEEGAGPLSAAGS